MWVPTGVTPNSGVIFLGVKAEDVDSERVESEREIWQTFMMTLRKLLFATSKIENININYLKVQMVPINHKADINDTILCNIAPGLQFLCIIQCEDICACPCRASDGLAF